MKRFDNIPGSSTVWEELCWAFQISLVPVGCMHLLRGLWCVSGHVSASGWCRRPQRVRRAGPWTAADVPVHVFPWPVEFFLHVHFPTGLPMLMEQIMFKNKERWNTIMFYIPLTFFWALQRVSSISSSRCASSFLFSFLICSMAISRRSLADSNIWTWPANSSNSSSCKWKQWARVSHKAQRLELLSHLIFDFNFQFVFGSSESSHVSIWSTFCSHFIQFLGESG